MPLTAIDPQTALVVIDLQKGIATPPTIHPIHEVVNNACALATVFRSYGLPVILVNVAEALRGDANGELRRDPKDGLSCKSN